MLKISKMVHTKTASNRVFIKRVRIKTVYTETIFMISKTLYTESVSKRLDIKTAYTGTNLMH